MTQASAGDNVGAGDSAWPNAGANPNAIITGTTGSHLSLAILTVRAFSLDGRPNRPGGARWSVPRCRSNCQRCRRTPLSSS